MAEEIKANRLATWQAYNAGLSPLAAQGIIELPIIPEGCDHNAHMFYIKVRDLEMRTALIQQLKQQGVFAVSHYVPLHSAPAGKRFGRFDGEDRYTTKESERLLRLPMFYGLTTAEVERVIQHVTTAITALSAS